MTMKSVMFNNNLLISKESLNERGVTKSTLEEKAMGFPLMIRDALQSGRDGLTSRVNDKQSSIAIKSEDRTGDSMDSLQSPIEGLRRAFLAKGISLDNVSLDKKDLKKLKSILDKLDYPPETVSSFFLSLLKNYSENEMTLSDFFKDFNEFEANLKNTPSSRNASPQNILLDKATVPHIESALRDLGMAPESLDSLLPSVVDEHGKVNMETLTQQLKKFQNFPKDLSVSSGIDEKHNFVLTPKVVDAMGIMGLAIPDTSLGSPFSMDDLIGLMETKVSKNNGNAHSFEDQKLAISETVDDISAKIVEDDQKINNFFGYAQEMIDMDNFQDSYHKETSSPLFRSKSLKNIKGILDPEVAVINNSVSALKSKGQNGAIADSRVTVSGSQKNAKPISATDVRNDITGSANNTHVNENPDDPIHGPVARQSYTLSARAVPPHVSSTDEPIASVSDSLNSRNISLGEGKESIIKDAKVMEMASPNHLLNTREILKGTDRFRRNMDVTFSLPRGKLDRSTVPQMIATINGTSLVAKGGVSKEMDALIDDFLLKNGNHMERIQGQGFRENAHMISFSDFEQHLIPGQKPPIATEIFKQSTTSSDAPLPSNLLENVGKEIASFIQRGERVFKLQLKPAELGTVTLEMDTKRKTLKLSIVAESSSAKEMFLNNHNHLRQILQGHGVKLENLNIQMNSDFSQSLANGNNNSSSQNQGSTSQFNGNETMRDDVDGEEVSPKRLNKDALLDLLV